MCSIFLKFCIYFSTKFPRKNYAKKRFIFFFRHLSKIRKFWHSFNNDFVPYFEHCAQILFFSSETNSIPQTFASLSCYFRFLCRLETHLFLAVGRTFFFAFTAKVNPMIHIASNKKRSNCLSSRNIPNAYLFQSSKPLCYVPCKAVISNIHPGI